MVEGLPAEEAVGVLLTALRELSPVRAADPAGPLLALAERHGLTRLEAALYHRLLLARGAPVSKGDLYRAMYWDRVADADAPDPKIVDVLVSKTRRKLGAGAIHTHWGFGYSAGG
jgi:DNA-binding response OmpR family regulator